MSACADAVRCQHAVNHTTVCCTHYSAIRNDSLPTNRTTFVAPLCSHRALSALCSPACGGWERNLVQELRPLRVGNGEQVHFHRLFG